MKNVVVIPVFVSNEEALQLPLGDLGGTTLLEAVYSRAKSTNVDNVIVTSSSVDIGRFCASRKIAFFPSSRECPSGTHRCAEIASKFQPGKVSNVVCWPVTYPFVSTFDANEMLSNYYGEGVGTLASNVHHNLREEFNRDESYVKMRSVGEHLSDFSRCPLPLALCHIGIYMYSLPMLLQIGKIMPTKLSLEERLEQLSWTQYGFKNLVTITRGSSQGLPVAIRTIEQLQQQNLLLQEQTA